MPFAALAVHIDPLSQFDALRTHRLAVRELSNAGARLLSDVTRDTDLVATLEPGRYLVARQAVQDVRLLAERIQAAFEASTLQLEGHEMCFTVCLGAVQNAPPSTPIRCSNWPIGRSIRLVGRDLKRVGYSIPNRPASWFIPRRSPPARFRP